MAAHVFDATEPTFDSIPNRSAAAAGPLTAKPAVDGPMFTSEPTVFHKLQQRQRVGSGPLIGLAVGAVIVGGLVFAMSRHNQGANGATTGVHTTSQPPAQAMAAANPVPSPATGQANPAPVNADAAPAPRHLQIVSAPRAASPLRHVAVRAAPARSVAQRTSSPQQAAPAPEAVVNPPAAMAITPAPAPSAAPEAPAPALSTSAPPTPQPAPAPSTSAPDASASAGQPTPQ